MRRHRIYDRCQYVNCQNGKHNNFHLFRFPTSLDRQKIWIENSGNPSLKTWAPKSLMCTGLCMDHFRDIDYFQGKKLRLRVNRNPIHWKEAGSIIKKKAKHLKKEPSTDFSYLNNENSNLLMKEEPIDHIDTVFLEHEDCIKKEEKKDEEQQNTVKVEDGNINTCIQSVENTNQQINISKEKISMIPSLNDDKTGKAKTKQYVDLNKLQKLISEKQISATVIDLSKCPSIDLNTTLIKGASLKLNSNLLKNSSVVLNSSLSKNPSVVLNSNLLKSPNVVVNSNVLKSPTVVIRSNLSRKSSILVNSDSLKNSSIALNSNLSKNYNVVLNSNLSNSPSIELNSNSLKRPGEELNLNLSKKLNTELNSNLFKKSNEVLNSNSSKNLSVELQSNSSKNSSTDLNSSLSQSSIVELNLNLSQSPSIEFTSNSSKNSSAELNLDSSKNSSTEFNLDSSKNSSTEFNSNSSKNSTAEVDSNKTLIDEKLSKLKPLLTPTNLREHIINGSKNANINFNTTCKPEDNRRSTPAGVRIPPIRVDPVKEQEPCSVHCKILTYSIRNTNKALEKRVHELQLELKTEKKKNYRLRKKIERINTKKKFSIEEYLDKKGIEGGARTMINLQLHNNKAQYASDEKELTKQMYFYSAICYSRLRAAGLNLPAESSVRAWLAHEETYSD